jgi:hypothetical protein
MIKQDFTLVEWRVRMGKLVFLNLRQYLCMWIGNNRNGFNRGTLSAFLSYIYK